MMTIIIISIITSVVLGVSITYFVKEIIEHDLNTPRSHLPERRWREQASRSDTGAPQ